MAKAKKKARRPKREKARRRRSPPRSLRRSAKKSAKKPQETPRSQGSGPKKSAKKAAQEGRQEGCAQRRPPKKAAAPKPRAQARAPAPATPRPRPSRNPRRAGRRLSTPSIATWGHCPTATDDDRTTSRAEPNSLGKIGSRAAAHNRCGHITSRDRSAVGRLSRSMRGACGKLIRADALDARVFRLFGGHKDRPVPAKLLLECNTLQQPFVECLKRLKSRQMLDIFASRQFRAFQIAIS